MCVQSSGADHSLKIAMAFNREWRQYQSRLLDHLDGYLGDRRLHLVAAPGSGKTVLGLEVARRIDQPTLVLTPTITIRDQWIDRLVELFLPHGEGAPSWVSRDLRAPAFLTVSTYQALHAAFSGQPNPAALPEADEIEQWKDHDEADGNGETGNHGSDAHLPIPEFLSRAKFRTLVLDEAHHLRAQWWRALTSLAGQLESPTIVALTATPPYDVPPAEWQRYERLCGPIDAEVSVPELVHAGDLCPHQDYVFFSAPTEKEQAVISGFRESVEAFVSRLRSNVAFSAAIRAHPWLSASDEHTEEILDDPGCLSSMVIFLNAVGDRVSPAVFAALGLSRHRPPELNLEWLEVLLSNCLYDDANHFEDRAPALRSIRQELLEMGAIERRKVTLRSPSDQLKLLTSSTTKLKSIEKIVKLEAAALGDALRCVILTDFIRKSELPKAGAEPSVFEDIGVVPVFESLRLAAVAGVRLGVLSGSLVIVPTDGYPMVRELAAGIGIDTQDLSCCQMAHDASFSTVEIRGEYYRGAVRLITALFERGGITVLVGTKSLLGEGWDAPGINTLILASFVGSFVLSNQMRGRAIRVDPSQAGKTANIWHLVCAEAGPLGPGDDYALLVRRCSAFAGVSAAAAVIENGTERLGFGHPPFTRSDLLQFNAETRRRALDRARLRQQWQQGLESGATKQLIDGLKAPGKAVPRGYLHAATIGALLVQGGCVAFYTFEQTARALVRTRMASDFWTFVLSVVATGAVASLPWTVSALWRLARHGTPEGSIRQIGRAILDSLMRQGSIVGDAAELHLHAEKRAGGTVFCWMSGGTGKEQATFARALRETLSPIDNPRYLLARRTLWRVFREDYFAVPEVLARRKESAEFFAQRWNRLVGPARLVFTRTPQGRARLLRGRSHSLSGAFQGRAERVSCWK